jgi:HK97 family phage portal protein
MPVEMANPLQTAWSVLNGSYLRPGVEQKFSPGDPTVNWQYVNHLVMTANTVAYGGDDSGDGNSAVFACLRALAYASIEAPLRVFKLNDKNEREPQPENPLQLFLDEPHPELDMLELRFWTSWARHADGNAYLLKVRAGNSRTGEPVELWPISPMRMEPHTERGSRNFIDSYRLKSSSGRGDEFIPVENVIHFKLGVDPLDVRKGISPLKRLLREIASDAEATRFANALLANFGVPGLVVTTPQETILNPKQIEDLKQNMRDKFGHQNRGDVGVLTGGADMKQFGFSPEQLNLKILHDFPETRIAAVMGVDPLVARLGVGLEQTSNYASSRQVRENFTELTIVPLWRMDEAKWNKKVTRDFTDDRNIVIAHDLTEVRALQEDENDKHARIRDDFKAGLITRETALRVLGYDPDLAEDETLMVPTNVTYVLVKDATTDPAQKQADALALQAAKPAPALPGKPTSAADQPAASKALLADLFPEIVQGIVDRAAVDFEDDLNRLQDGQRKRVHRALVNGTVGE